MVCGLLAGREDIGGRRRSARYARYCHALERRNEEGDGNIWTGMSGESAQLYSRRREIVRLCGLGRHHPNLGRPDPRDAARPGGIERRVRARFLARWPAAGVGRRRKHPHALGRRHWNGGVATDWLSLAGPVHAFSPDGRLLATGGGALDNRPGAQGEVKLWDVAKQSVIATLEGHTRGVLAIAFTPDGTRLATGGLDETIRVWDVQTGQPRLTLGGLGNCAEALAFSRDGRMLAWSGRSDGLVSLHDTTTGAEVVRLIGHGAVVRGIAFAPDGTGAATSGADRTIKLWDVPAFEPSLSATRWKGNRWGVRDNAPPSVGNSYSGIGARWIVRHRGGV